MASLRPVVSLPLSAFAAALLLGSAPGAWAQCQAGAGGTAAQDMTTQQQTGSASGETGAATGQDDTAMAEDSEITAGQGGTTTGEGGEVTAQSATGTTPGKGEPATGQTAAVDSPEIQGADEKQIKNLLEEQGYTEVSSIYSCGTYYEANAAKDGKQVTLQVDLSTGRISEM